MISRSTARSLLLAIILLGTWIYCVGQINNITKQASSLPEIGVLNAAYGSADIRSAAQISSKIIGRLHQNEFVYFIRSESQWWRLTTRNGEGVSSDPPPPPEQNGYVQSSRIVPIKNLPISKIESLYGQEWKKEKKEFSFGNIRITILNSERMNYSGAHQIPEMNSAYLEIVIPGKKPIRKYYPDIEGVGGAADIRFVPIPSITDFGFFVKNGDYDGRTIIVARDGRVADLDGGGLFVYKKYLISRTGADCCGEPVIWDLKLWKKAYDLRDDKSIEVKSEPQYSYYAASGHLYLKLETPYGLYLGENIPRFFRLNEEGHFVRELNPPPMEDSISVLPEDLWR
jgi:hypothetical protein